MKDALDGCHTVAPHGIVIVESCYWMIIELRPFCDATVFVDPDPDICLIRGLARDGELARESWLNWINGEEKYFAEQSPRSISTYIYQTK